PVPGERFKSRKPRLGEGGNISDLRDALLARHRKQANGSAVRLRHCFRQGREIDGNVTGDDVGQRRRATLVAHGGHLESCAFEKQHRREMTEAPEYRGHVVQFVGAAAGIVDKFGKRSCWDARVDEENVRIGPDDADGSEIFHRVIRRFRRYREIAICDGLPISSICPSADERATASAASAPTAAGRFSTTNCCPNASPSGCAIRRAMPSLLPPGAKGTRILTGFCGQICERAD